MTKNFKVPVSPAPFKCLSKTIIGHDYIGTLLEMVVKGDITLSVSVLYCKFFPEFYQYLLQQQMKSLAQDRKSNLACVKALKDCLSKQTVLVSFLVN